MTVDPTKLLQMLEPTVRPGASGVGGGAQQARPAFEDRSFQDLLSEASKQMAPAGETAPQAADPLAALGGLGRVENAALRSVLEQAGRAGDGPGNNE